MNTEIINDTVDRNGACGASGATAIPIEKLSGFRVPLPLLGEALIAVRKERGLSQQDLAMRLGTVQEAVARMEQQKYRSVSLERLVRVAEALDLLVSCDAWAKEPTTPANG